LNKDFLKYFFAENKNGMIFSSEMQAEGRKDKYRYKQAELFVDSTRIFSFDI
jgi:hypothetical protein